MKILSVVGARPNFMKIAPIISAIEEYNSKKRNETESTNSSIRHILVHTGQHYDNNMSEAFFNDLNIPKPDIHLNIGSASHAIQTAEIMKRFEEVLLRETPDIMIVVGDVNSTLACALVASKISYTSRSPGKGTNKMRRKPLIAHVEAGLRSFDRSMPEELNRILTDHLSDLLFITEESAMINLKSEGISDDKIFFVGNTMIDTLLTFKSLARKSSILERLGLIEKHRKDRARMSSASKASVTPYVLLTLHRPSNVDDKETFSNIIDALKEISENIPIIFPAHPRTEGFIKEFGLEAHFNRLSAGPMKAINIISPLGYLDFLCLMMNAEVVLTDSGGIQEETTCLGIPCITIRENTERPVTVKEGTNILAAIRKESILSAFKIQIERRHKKNRPMLWDGKAAKRIVKIIADNFS